MRANTPAAKKTDAHGRLQTAALAKRSGIVFISSIAGRILNFATQVLLSNTLGLVAFGAFTLGQSLLSFLTSFSQAGLHHATTRYLAIGRAQQQPGMVRGVMRFAAPRVVAVSCALGMALVLLREPVAKQIFHKPELAPVLFWTGMVLPFLCVMNWLGFALRGFRAVQAEAVLKDVAHPMLFILLCAGGLSFSVLSSSMVWGAFWLSTAAAVLYGGVCVYRHVQALPPAPPEVKIAKEIRRPFGSIVCS